MKYYRYIVSVFICFWLHPGVSFAHEPAGSNGQLQYNDNGTLAGAEIYYSNQNPQLDILGTLRINEDLKIGNIAVDANFSITTAPHKALLKIDPAPCPYCVAAIELKPGFITLMSDYVVAGNRVVIGGAGIPQATLDVNGYAKLKPYSSPPVSCTPSRRGIIVMNGNYDLCVCKPGFSLPSTRGYDLRGPGDYIPIPTSYRLVRNPNIKCW